MVENVSAEPVPAFALDPGPSQAVPSSGEGGRDEINSFPAPFANIGPHTGWLMFSRYF